MWRRWHGFTCRQIKIDAAKRDDPGADGRRQIARGAASSIALRRIARASSSMERPCLAARIRKRSLMSSSRLRIVMLAILPSEALQPE